MGDWWNETYLSPKFLLITHKPPDSVLWNSLLLQYSSVFQLSVNLSYITRHVQFTVVSKYITFICKRYKICIWPNKTILQFFQLPAKKVNVMYRNSVFSLSHFEKKSDITHVGLGINNVKALLPSSPSVPHGGALDKPDHTHLPSLALLLPCLACLHLQSSTERAVSSSLSSGDSS